MVRSNNNIPWSLSWRRRKKVRWEGFAEKLGFQPGVKEWGGWMMKSGESLEEVIGMGELEFDRLV